MVKISVLTTTIRPKGLDIVQHSLSEQSFTDFEWLVDVNWTGKSDFNKSMNGLLKRANGELIVSLQDYIKAPPDALQRLWEAYQKEPAFYTCPVGRSATENYDNPIWDWRIERENCNWLEWEIDLGSAPKQALLDIGGFDEELDKYWGFDNVNVGLRADIAGWKFKCLKNVRAIAYDHNANMEHPFQKLRNSEFHNEQLEKIRHGEWKSSL